MFGWHLDSWCADHLCQCDGQLSQRGRCTHAVVRRSLVRDDDTIYKHWDTLFFFFANAFAKALILTTQAFHLKEKKKGSIHILFSSYWTCLEGNTRDVWPPFDQGQFVPPTKSHSSETDRLRNDKIPSHNRARHWGKL